MSDRNHKIHQLLGELKKGEQIPSFEHLWSEAERMGLRAEPSRRGSWRWALAPMVAAGAISALVVLMIQVDRPVAPPERRDTPSHGGTLLADLDDIEIPEGRLDSMLTEPSWLNGDDLDADATDTDEDEQTVASLVLGDTMYAGATGFLLERDISNWDEPSERNVP